MTKLDPAPLIDAYGHGVRGLARALGIDPAVLCRPITVTQAERFADQLGLHPIEIWPAADYYDEAAAFDPDKPPPPRKKTR